MSHEDDTAELRALRRDAEAAFARAPSEVPPVRDREVDHLVHELQVQQIELRLQNEELREAQLQLERSRDRYYELYDLAPAGYLSLDRRGRIEEANLTAAELLGLERAQLIGRALSSLMREHDADALHLHLREVFETGGKCSCEVQLPARPGAEAVQIHIDSVASSRSEGARTSCRSVLIDLTSLRRTEDALQAWQARGQAILDTVAEAVVGCDARGRIESFNPAAERLFGYRAAEVLDHDVAMLLPASRLDPQDEPVHESNGLRKDGTAFPVELSIGSWLERDQPKLTAIIRDLSARQRAERELRDSETRFRRIATHLHHGLVIIDRHGARLSYANPAFESILGATMAQLQADPHWIEWIHPEDRPRIEQAYRRYREGERFEEQMRLRHAGGETRWLEASMVPIEEHGEPVDQDIGLLRDVTAEHLLEEQLRQAQKMQAVGALASGVAHDFNNVLQAIVGCVNVARRADTEPARAAEFLDRAARAAIRGGTLASQLMAFTRKQDADPRPIELDAELSTIVPLLERLVTERITVQLHAGAPRATLVADPVQIDQILMNLAANARDAMPDGGTMSIRTSVIELPEPAEGPGGSKPGPRSGNTKWIRLVVQDSGAGMDEPTRSRIFEPFFTTKALGRGTGLGLSTVFTVVQHLRGRIEVDSERGRGTRFVLSFPYVGVSPRKREPSGAQWLSSMSGTVLLVEDDPVVRLTVRHYLQELGLDVLEARDGDDAVRISALHPEAVDVLVSDVILPRMRGPELAATMRGRYPELRVLLMSASPELAEQIGSDLGDAPILSKPFSVETLARALRPLMMPGSGAAHSPAPLAAPPLGSAPVAAAAPSPAPAGSADQRSRSMLIVEDQDVSREALTELLEGEGYRVHAAAEPAAALAIMAEHGPAIDLLLTDVHLPHMTGIELADRLQLEYPHLRVLVMSGGHEPPDRSRVFVRKPIDFEALLALLEHSREQ